MESVRRWPLTGALVSLCCLLLNRLHLTDCQYTGETPLDYLKAIANREIAWLNTFAVPKPPNDMFLASQAQNSPSSHLSLYKMFLRIIPYLLPQNKKLSASTLWHWDIDSANLFVEGDRITSLIDWQDTWVGPLFLQFRHPKLVDYNGDFLLKLPETYESLEEGDEKARNRKQVEKSIVLYSYERDTEKENSLLGEILHIPLGRIRRETVQFVSDTWDGDILPFRQCLVRIERFVRFSLYSNSKITNLQNMQALG